MIISCLTFVLQKHRAKITMEKKDKRKFFTLAVTEEEFAKVNDLIVAVVEAEKKPVDRTDLMRKGLDAVAMEYTGEAIFNEPELTT